MIENKSLKNQLLILIIPIIAISMLILFYYSYTNLKSKVDDSKERFYSQKIDSIIYLIDEKYTKLKKLGMMNSYEESFKKGTVNTIKEVFLKNPDEAYPFIIDEENKFILHKTYTLKDSYKYETDKNFLEIVKLKEGTLDLIEADKDTWIIFKSFEPWNWVIGYKVNKELKYKELYDYRNSFFISAILFLLLVSVSILFVVKTLLKPVTKLTKVSKEIASGNLDADIEVFGANELKELAKNFKIMRDKISDDFSKIKDRDLKLKEFNKKLRSEVDERTKELQDSNDELETSIENLKKTQTKLIESEKLAGLGSLVAGVAHEINTPVGIGLTGSSHLDFLSEQINEKYKSDEMTKEDFEGYLSSSSDLVKVINTNLNRTADIIKNFKQVAIDQTSEQKRVFNLKEYVRGVLVSIDSIIKNKDIKTNIDCDDKLEIISYPGFFAQIITNLVSNSAMHAFSDGKSGNINFIIKREENQLTFIYSDDGKGISEKNLSKIYEPFFSTNKEAGGSGLGMNIIYNIVTINLKGTIDCKSKENVGTRFNIVVPL